MQRELPEGSEGGDPPCWAHLFDEERGGKETASLPAPESGPPSDDEGATSHTERQEIVR